MDTSVSTKEQFLSKQAHELRYLERKVKKLVVANKWANGVAGFMFALQICLINFCILMAVCDEPIRVIAMQMPVVQKLYGFMANILALNPFSVMSLVRAILFLFAIPLLLTILCKWIVFLLASPPVLTSASPSSYTELAGSATDLYEVSKEYPDKAMGSRILWGVILHIISAIPFVLALLKSGLENSYIGTEILGLLLWTLLIVLFVWLLGLIIRPAVNAMVSGLDMRIEAKHLSTKLEELREQKEPRPKKTVSSPKPAKSQTSSASSYSSSSSSAAIDMYDSFTWTNEYVRNNEAKCSDIALSTLKVSKEFLEERNYSSAAAGFDKVVRALELLKNIDSSYYTPPLFANCYALSQIYAFGLNNRSSACKYVKKACDYAQQCNTDTARRDLAVMRDVCRAFESSRSTSSILDEFDFDFPYSILRMH